MLLEKLKELQNNKETRQIGDIDEDTDYEDEEVEDEDECNDEDLLVSDE